MNIVGRATLEKLSDRNFAWVCFHFSSLKLHTTVALFEYLTMEVNGTKKLFLDLPILFYDTIMIENNHELKLRHCSTRNV